MTPGVRMKAMALRAAPAGGVVALLSLATWLYAGYRYIVFPQPGFLDFVFRYDGALHNDWQTQGPPPHWAVTHVLGLLPAGWVEPTILVLWLVTLVVLWSAFVSICRSLGLGLTGALAAGLVAIATEMGGFGNSQILFNFFYASMASFAVALAALAAVLRGRPATAGALLGGAILLHPRIGALATGALALAVFLGVGDRRRTLIRFLVPLVLIGGVPLVQVYLEQAAGNGVPAKVRYDLEVYVRGPAYMLYSAFKPVDYARTLLWTTGIAAGTAVLWSSLPARRIAVVAASVIAICGAGAVASQAGGPLSLVLLQTSHLSALLVVLGVVVVAGALNRLAGQWTTPLLLGTFLLTPLIAYHGLPGIYQYVPGTRSLFSKYSSISAVEALLLLVLLGGFALARRSAALRERLGRAPQLGAAAAVALSLACAISLVVKQSDRAPHFAGDEAAFRDVARHTTDLTGPTDVILTPPRMDAFRSLSRRPIVVEWGSVRHADGFYEWRRRIIDATGNPHILDRSLGSDIDSREALMTRSYDTASGHSKIAICRYGARYVVLHTSVPLPAWLSPVYRNGYYGLARVRPGTCSKAAS